MASRPFERTEGPENYSVREIKPKLGRKHVAGEEWLTKSLDLVEEMDYFFVRIFKPRNLPVIDNVDLSVEVRVGNHKGSTKRLEKNLTPEWNQVFAFSCETIQASEVEIVLKNGHFTIGRIGFELGEVPKRLPPDTSLAPEWNQLEDENGVKLGGELLLSVWMGSQADEMFRDAWHCQAVSISTEDAVNLRSMVYVSPKLWYLRVNVIEAKALISSGNRRPNAYAKCVVGDFASRTKVSQSRSINPMWNEDLMFVVAEPFDEQLILTVADQVNSRKDEILGVCSISLQTVTKRFDPSPVPNKWHSLDDKYVVGDDGQLRNAGSTGRIHVRICLEGGYHVFDGSTHYSSDLNATAKQLWKPSIGVLQLGILSAQGLVPTRIDEGRWTGDAYCVAKYGSRWVRTRTIINSLAPKWNEQYSWEVFDPCTVITIGVFDCALLQGGQKATDNGIGKVRIRLSTLESGRLYAYSYPLLVIKSTGLEKMGEIQLALRFIELSKINLMRMYSQPLMPRMHYVNPLSTYQKEALKNQAFQITSLKLSRAEPPLKKEVVAYLLELDSNTWSIRRSKTNYHRVLEVLSTLNAMRKWFSYICHWKKPAITFVAHIIHVILVLYSRIIPPAIFTVLFFMGLWNFLARPRHPPHVDIKLSLTENVSMEDLDEEYDPIPTKRGTDLVKMRYARLRDMAGRLQMLIGELATQGERIQSLLSWRDPRASFIFVMFCSIAAVMLSIIPFKWILIFAGFYFLRHPRFRSDVPSATLNFFRRLPAKAECIL